MKKLLLIVGAAALVFPTLADAKGNKDQADTEHYTYKKVDMSSSDDNRSEYRIELQSEKDFRSRVRNQTFSTLEGEKLQIDGDTVYKTVANGDRFYAPNGAYPTKNGVTVVVQDGQLLRVENTPTEVFTIN